MDHKERGFGSIFGYFRLTQDRKAHSFSLSQIPSLFFLFGLNKVFGVLISYIWYEATKLRYAIKKHCFLYVYAGIWTDLNRAKGDG